jgi:subtilisin family serine protease
MKKLVTLLLGLSISLFTWSQAFKEGYLTFKIQPEQKVHCLDGQMNVPEIQQVLQSKSDAIYKRFPFSKPPVARFKGGYRTVDLSLVYEVKLTGTGEEQKLVNLLNQLAEIEYACLNYHSEITLTPNDPFFGDQYHHSLINTPQAWDIQTGGSTVRIAILDTGSDLDHPDLTPTTINSSLDPVNGVDDDNNGYIDDNQGWDFVDNDRVPQATVNDHGVHVAGLATAAVNNAIGISGTGYNCIQVPIRVGEDRSITDGYDGVVYAADQGFDIINCSWGSFSFSPLAQDVVTYASVNKGALVVAAAGNNGKDQPFYPAAYEHVLAVGATQQTNEFTSFSNRGYWVDLSAPGQSIQSTLNDGNYGLNTGTSMSSPIVAGIAGLVKSQYPQLTGLQVAERLKTTTTDISNVGSNSQYEGKYGTGLINAQAAVNGVISNPSVVYESIQLTDNNNNAFSQGDTVRVGGIYINYLDSSDELTAELSTSSAAVQLLDSVFLVGELPSLGSRIQYNLPFEFLITNQAGINEEVVFDLTISGGGYQTVQRILIDVNVDYVNVLVNDIETSIAGNSSLGYLEREGSPGLGFRFVAESSQLFEAGLMVGLKKSNQVMVIDNIRDGQELDEDFSAVNSIFERQLNDTAFAAYASFSDEQSTGDSAGVSVSLKAFAFEENGHREYVLLNYTIRNTSTESFDSLYVSLFTDWDIAPYEQNRAKWNSDYQVNFSYVPGDLTKVYFCAQ